MSGPTDVYDLADKVREGVATADDYAPFVVELLALRASNARLLEAVRNMTKVICVRCRSDARAKWALEVEAWLSAGRSATWPEGT